MMQNGEVINHVSSQGVIPIKSDFPGGIKLRIGNYVIR